MLLRQAHEGGAGERGVCMCSMCGLIMKPVRRIGGILWDV